MTSPLPVPEDAEGVLLSDERPWRSRWLGRGRKVCIGYTESRNAWGETVRWNGTLRLWRLRLKSEWSVR